MSQNDDRNGLPSASGMERIVLCPGSFALSKEVPENLRPSDSIYSQKGTAIAALVEAMFHQKFKEDDDTHEVWAFLAASRFSVEAGLTTYDETREVVNEAKRMYRAAKYQWRELMVSLHPGGSFPDIDDPRNVLFAERRIWRTGRTYNSKTSGYYSAKPDLVVFNSEERVAMVLDFKSGWLPVNPAFKNHQITSTIGLLYSCLDGSPGSRTLSHVSWRYYGAIIQPNQPKAMSTVEFQTADAIKFANAYQKIASDAVTVLHPENHLKPSKDACKYCDARLTCPAVNTLAKQVAYGQFTPTSIKQALEVIEILDVYSESWKQKAKELLEKDPTSIPGYGLEKSGTTTKITDPVGAYETVKDLVPPDQFMGACNVAIGKLTDVFSKASKLPKAKARDALMTRLGTTVKQEEKAPKLVRTDLITADHES